MFKNSKKSVCLNNLLNLINDLKLKLKIFLNKIFEFLIHVIIGFLISFCLFYYNIIDLKHIKNEKYIFSKKDIIITISNKDDLILIDTRNNVYHFQDSLLYDINYFYTALMVGKINSK